MLKNIIPTPQGDRMKQNENDWKVRFKETFAPHGFIEQDEEDVVPLLISWIETELITKDQEYKAKIDDLQKRLDFRRNFDGDCASCAEKDAKIDLLVEIKDLQAKIAMFVESCGKCANPEEHWAILDKLGVCHS